MITKNIFLWALTAASVLFTCSCSDDNVDPAPEPFGSSDRAFEAIVENEQALVFDSQAKDSFNIQVKSAQPWKVTKDASWIKILLNDDDSFTVSAEKNRSVENRISSIKVSAGEEIQTFDVLQTKGKVRLYTINGDAQTGVGGIPSKAVSLNGRYVLGSSSAGTWICDLDLVNPGDAITMDIDVSEFTYLPTENANRAISNHGELGQDGISPDGRFKIEYTTANSYTTPFVIRDGWKIELEHPKDAQIGTLLPHSGYQTKGISADGSYIVGKHITYRGGYAECGWKYNEATGQYQYIFYPDGVLLDNNEWIINSPNPEYVSPHGKYTAGRYYPWGGTEEEQDENGWNGINFPYFRDLSTGEISILRDYPGYGAIFITDDGLLGIATQLGNTRIVDTTKPEESMSLVSWIEKTYKIDPDEYGIVNGLMYTMIPDKSTLVWSYLPPGKRLYWSMVLTIE